MCLISMYVFLPYVYSCIQCGVKYTFSCYSARLFFKKMANPGTLGMPGFVPSNTTGQPGVSQGQMGRLGSGVLQTIEEGQGAFSSEVMYYDKSVGYYQLPQVQRSHGDDIRSLNITNFGARSTVTIPRKFFNFGPSYLRFRLPINYAWSGCEYVSNTYNCSTTQEVIGSLKVTDLPVLNAAVTNTTAVRIEPQVQSANAGLMHFESSGCDTMLPTSFQSGGMAFAFPAQIELNLGGAGQITFDRYSNWALLMASTPFLQGRKDLMRMAGGGLNLNDPYEARQAPVRWGKKEWACAAGYSNVQVPLVRYASDRAGNINLAGYTSIEPVQVTKTKIVPIEWDVLLPIKTPETNFMYALTRRKPLDTSILAGDMQLNFTWSNFNEWTDTGKGYPNAPVYYAHRAPLATSGNVRVTGHGGPYTGAAEEGYSSVLQDTQFVCTYANEIGAPVRVNVPGLQVPLITAVARANIGTVQFPLINTIAYSPVVWTNHYRVAAGAKLVEGIHFDATDVSFRWSTDAGVVQAPQGEVGRPRFPQFLQRNNDADIFFKSLQSPANQINATVSYPDRFSSIEYINSSLKLTNPALGARNALMVDKEAVVYYPFQYSFSQIYRVPSKYKDYKHWTAANLQSNLLSDLYSEANKHSQLIQMPANPCTSMLVSIFREKDRQTNVQGKLNSYSPVLFWNALNPERMVLKDGGNTLFEYFNSIDFELYSMMDRPDALKIPFRGGHCKVQPQNLYGNRHIPTSAMNRGVPRYVRRGGNVFGNVVEYPASNPDTLADEQRINPFWFIGMNAAKGAIGVGFAGTGTPASSANSFPADELCNSVALNAGCKQFQPCHTTEWYEATIMEFPFVMNEPIVNEKIVQNTPSFAKTQLQLDFWINPKLKPDNGMDDMYDTTYGLTRAFPDGVGATLLDQTNTHISVFTYPSPGSHPVPHCLHEKAEPESLDLLVRDSIGSMAAGAGLTTFLKFDGKYADGFDFTAANSWNINNGDLMLHVVFCQNQVWALSPLRTSLFSARG